MPGNNRSSANLSLCERIFLKLILLLIFPRTFCLKFSILELPILNSELPNNVTIYPTNENARLTLICESVGQPIQIVYNYQLNNLRDIYFTKCDQYLRRTVPDSTAANQFFNTSNYHYKAVMHTRISAYRGIKVIACEIVSNPNTKIAIRFHTLNSSSSVDSNANSSTNSLSIEMYKRETEVAAPVVRPIAVSNDYHCPVILQVQETENGAQWKCLAPKERNDAGKLDLELTPNLSFAYCYSMPDCHNLVRDGQINSNDFTQNCVQRLDRNQTCEGCVDAYHYVTLEKRYHPQIVICTAKKMRKSLVYFYSFPPDGKHTSHKLYLSWNDVNPEDMLFIMEPKPNQEFFVGDPINFICHAIKYYFAAGYRIAYQHHQNNNETLDPILIIPEITIKTVREGTTNAIIVKNTIVINKVGEVTIYCFGPVINSSEWINKSVNLIIKEKLNSHANVTFPIIPSNQNSDSSLESIIPRLVMLAVGIVMVLIGVYIWKLRRAESKLLKLSDEEIKFFREGKSISNNNLEVIEFTSEDTEPDIEGPFVDNLPYNAQFDIPMKQLRIDEKAILGSGAYGIVTKGVVWIGNELIDVAVKTVRPGVELCYLKALLSELKIMAHLGNSHENIVCLIAACTENLRKGEVFIAAELCKSSLLNTLQKTKTNNCFMNQLNFSSASQIADAYINLYQVDYNTIQGSPVPSENELLSTFGLLNWSYQLADGMDFVASKKIVHGDLSARNVLLNNDNVIKICDFGLARQLVDYNYIKTEQCPLPWKWMAIESLAEMRFSISSDVWAYGITLWEIFSLGEIPYPGLNWSPDFVQQLNLGLRMSLPTYAANEIYQIMVACWELEPKSRPTFLELKSQLESQIQVLKDSFR